MPRVLIVGGWPNVVLAAVLLTASAAFHLMGLDAITLVLVGHLSGLLVPTAHGRTGRDRLTGKDRTDMFPRVVNRREPPPPPPMPLPAPQEGGKGSGSDEGAG